MGLLLRTQSRSIFDRPITLFFCASLVLLAPVLGCTNDYLHTNGVSSCNGRRPNNTGSTWLCSCTGTDEDGNLLSEREPWENVTSAIAIRCGRVPSVGTVSGWTNVKTAKRIVRGSVMIAAKSRSTPRHVLAAT